MVIALLIALGVIVYLIIGRTILNIFEDRDWVDVDEWKAIAIIIFPLVLIWVLFYESSEYLTNEILKLMGGKKKSRW